MSDYETRAHRAIFAGFVFILPILAIWTTMVVRGIKFDIGCESRLKRAADASTVEIAHNEMGEALRYLREHNMTDGYTSILYKTPDEDVGFWYRNLSAAADGLEKARNDKAADEKVVLLKLRQTLMDHNEHGEEVTHPAGIYKFPHNVAYCGAQLAGIIIAVVGGLLIFAGGDELGWW